MKTKLAGNGADATLYVDDVFSTYLYTGNGSTQTITNGIDLAGKGGMVWIKARNDATTNACADTARGGSNSIYSNGTTAQQSTGMVSSFNSNGFTLGVDTYPFFNFTGTTYASWTFRKAAKFFDVVTYTGDGTGLSRAIPHSLGVAPAMIIIKATNATQNWKVYHVSTGFDYYLELNMPDAASNGGTTIWGTTATTFSTLSYNTSGTTYVAYLYAHDTSSTGIIQCGSFTTNAGGTGAVNLGWEPQYLMYKRTDTTENWQVFDTMRGFVSGPAVDTSDDALLIPNTSAAESTQSRGRPTATGFDAWTGFGTAPYIYMAIRRPNKPPTTGTQVFSPVKQAGGGTVTTGFPVDLSINTKPTSAFDRYAVDRLRGVSKTTFPHLVTDTAAAEVAGSGYGFGFDNNTGYLDNGVYGSGETPIYWNFKRAPGFFDVVCYTGTGSLSQLVNHNLTVAPELIIYKCRSAGQQWVVACSAIGLTKQGYLDSTDAFFINYDLTATNSTVLAVGAANASTQTYVAYLFATLAGISKVGSYTGNGTGQAIACGFSAGARFVLIKRTDAAGAWYTFDSVRGLTSGSSPYLLLNSTAAEVTGNKGVYASTGGFTLGSTASTTTNINGASYIYLSVA